MLWVPKEPAGDQKGAQRLIHVNARLVAVKHGSERTAKEGKTTQTVSALPKPTEVRKQLTQNTKLGSGPADTKRGLMEPWQRAAFSNYNIGVDLAS